MWYSFCWVLLSFLRAYVLFESRDHTIEPRKYGSSARHATVPAGGLGELVEQRENVGVALPTMAFIQLRGGDESVVFQPVQSISGSAYEGVYQTLSLIHI